LLGSWLVALSFSIVEMSKDLGLGSDRDVTAANLCRLGRYRFSEELCEHLKVSEESCVLR
jgi:hypothetical protein